MALWICSGCSTAYAVGLPECPHCNSADHQEDNVPKISKEGGESAVTNAALDAEVAAQKARQADADAGVIPEDRVDLEARGAASEVPPEDDDPEDDDPEDDDPEDDDPEDDTSKPTGAGDHPAPPAKDSTSPGDQVKTGAKPAVKKAATTTHTTKTK